VVERAIKNRMEQTAATDHDAYLQQITPEELTALVELVVVPESWFYRDPQAFVAMTDFVRARLAANSDRLVRILSIPCAGGEEPYTMAMVLTDAGIPPENFIIDAYDISPACVARAQRHLRPQRLPRAGPDIPRPALHQRRRRRLPHQRRHPQAGALQAGQPAGVRPRHAQPLLRRDLLPQPADLLRQADHQGRHRQAGGAADGRRPAVCRLRRGAIVLPERLLAAAAQPGLRLAEGSRRATRKPAHARARAGDPPPRAAQHRLAAIAAAAPGPSRAQAHPRAARRAARSATYRDACRSAPPPTCWPKRAAWPTWATSRRRRPNAATIWRSIRNRPKPTSSSAC
jgi:chemotaxis protein methyltransferase WspC